MNLVYNAMPFKLIHLACALELPATPSIPHSMCQRSLCAEGVNVNSSPAWTEKSLKDTEREEENEDRKKIDSNYRDFSSNSLSVSIYSSVSTLFLASN